MHVDKCDIERRQAVAALNQWLSADRRVIVRRSYLMTAGVIASIMLSLVCGALALNANLLQKQAVEVNTRRAYLETVMALSKQLSEGDIEGARSTYQMVDRSHAGPEFSWLEHMVNGEPSFAFYPHVCITGTIAADGETYYYGNHHNEVYRSDPSGNLTSLIRLQSMPTSMNALDQGGLLIGTGSGDIMMIDQAITASRRHNLDDPSVFSIQIDDAFIAAIWPGSETHLVYVHDQTAGLVYLVNFASGEYTAVAEADRVITASTSRGWAMLRDIHEDGAIIRVVDPDFKDVYSTSYPKGEVPSALDVDPANGFFAIGTSEGGIRLHRLRDNYVERHMRIRGREVNTIMAIAIADYDERVYAVITDQMIAFDVTSAEEAAFFKTGRTLPVLDAKWNKNEGNLSIIDQTGVLLWNAEPRLARQQDSRS